MLDPQRQTIRDDLPFISKIKIIREDPLLILLILFGFFLLFFSIKFTGFALSLMGLSFLLVASIRYGFRGGLISFLWVSGILLLSLYLSPSTMMISHMGLTLVLLFFVSIGIGKSVDRFHSQQLKLAEKESHIKALVEALPDMIFIFDREGRFLDYYSDDQGKLFSKPHAFINKKVEDVLPPDLAMATKKHLTVLFSTKKTQKYQYTLPLMGEVHSFESRLVLYGDDKALAIIRDMTDMIRSQQDLLKSQKQYQDLIYTMEEGVAIVDEKEDITFANPAAHRIFGVHEGDLVGKNLAHFLYEEEYKLIQEKTSHRRLGERETYDLLIRQPSGEERSIYLTVTSKLEEDGISFFGVFRDITEEEEAKAQLRESKEYNQSIIEVIPDMMIRYDRRGTHLDIIAPSQNNLFRSKEELFGKKITDVLPQEEGTRFLEGITKALDCGSLQLVEFLLEVPSGLHWFEARIIPTSPHEVLSLIRDITEQKKTRKQLLIQHNMGLELAKITDLHMAYPIFLDAALKISGMDSGGIYLFNREDYSLTLVYHKGFTTPEFVERVSFFKGDSINTKIILQGDPIYSTHRDLIQINGIRAKEGLYALAILPIHNKGEVIASLQVASHTQTRIDPNVRTSLESITAQMGSIIARLQAEERIRYVSFHDNLTGLYNRAYLEEEINRLDTPRQLPISIIFGDINGLKLLNDTYGHDMGDSLLVKAAEILKKACREDDIISRWGGDEFVLFLPKTSAEDAQRICNRIVFEAGRSTLGNIPVQIALGSATKTHDKEEIYHIFQEAEDWMYKQKLLESRNARDAIISTLFKSLGDKCQETQDHTYRLKELGQRIGEQLKLPPSELNRLDLLLTLHDIGKITIHGEILNKPGILTKEEWEIIKNHPQTGHRIAMATDKFSPVASDILAHHENWDGSGYPQGLKGEEIPLLSRICRVVDAYDVMMHDRPYQKGMAHGEAIGELERYAGIQFDPMIVKIFLEIFGNKLVEGPPKKENNNPPKGDLSP